MKLRGTCLMEIIELLRLDQTTHKCETFQMLSRAKSHGMDVHLTKHQNKMKEIDGDMRGTYAILVNTLRDALFPFSSHACASGLITSTKNLRMAFWNFR